MNGRANPTQNINTQPLQGPGLETGRTEADALARRLAVTQQMSQALLDKSNELWARHESVGLPDDFVPPSNQGPVGTTGKWSPKLEPGKTWNDGHATPYDRFIGGKGQKPLPR